MAVITGNESSHVTYSGYQTVSDVTNDGDTAVTVKVTEHPYDLNGDKIGNRLVQTVTIPAHSTVKVKFNILRIRQLKPPPVRAQSCRAWGAEPVGKMTRPAPRCPPGLGTGGGTGPGRHEPFGTHRVSGSQSDGPAGFNSRIRRFNTPNFKKPYTSYTDIYDLNGVKLDGVLTPLVLDNLGAPTYAGQSHSGHFFAPFPWGIYDAFGPGWQGQFVVESISGVPPGWTVTVLHPELGVPFSLTPMDRENPGVLLVQTPPTVPEGTVVLLDILQRVVNAPDEPLYRVNQRVGICVDTTPPTVLLAETNPNMATRKIALRARGEDTVSGIGQMRVRFSNDGGTTWSYAPLVPPDNGDDNNAIWTGVIGPFCAGQAVKTVISISDGVGNWIDMPEQTTQF